MFLRLSRTALLSAVSLVIAVPLQAQWRSEDWQPITRADLEMKEVPGEPGAPAVLLFYAAYEDDNTYSKFFYHRIKILGEKGLHWANVDIPYWRNEGGALSDLKARTIRPDGSIVEFQGKVFDKVLEKRKGTKILAKTFSFPDVTVGSIVEYKYRWGWDAESRVLFMTQWALQHELYTVRALYSYYPYQKEFNTKHGMGRMSYVNNRMAANAKITPKNNRGYIELELKNVPGLGKEPHAPPESELRPQIHFYYGGDNIKSAPDFWNREGRDWHGAIEKFAGDRKEVRAEAQKVIGSEADPEKKLRLLYARAQQVRNLTYERPRSAEEIKREKLEENKHAGEVLARGYGTSYDITRLFAALARAAGYSAEVVRVSEREELFFDINVLSDEQLKAEAVLVNLNGKELFLDPGTRFCPFGLIRWTMTSAAGRKLDSKGGSFFQMPTPISTSAVTRRKGQLTLGEDGTLKGQVIIELTGQEALSRRLAALKLDEFGRNKDFEDDMKGRLHPSAQMKLVKSSGWESSEEPLVAEFEIEIPGYAALAGKRMVLTTGIFQAQQRNPFAPTERKHPVYFEYPYQELDNIRIKLPAEYQLESMPPEQKQNSPYGAILTSRGTKSGELFLGRGFQLESLFLPVEHYPGLRDFYSKVQIVDEEQVVLRRADSASASN
jgi:hypothetical protein